MPKAAPKRVPDDPEEAVVPAPSHAGLHSFKMPNQMVQPLGAQVVDQRSVSVLTQLDNFLAYARIPRKKAVAAGKLLVWAIRWQKGGPQAQTLWSYVISILATHTASDGYRSEQAVNVLVAEKQAQARQEALTRLADMGPKPKEPDQSGQ